tara:strand:- start:206 stop:364 length:159 start_codon:yes stop_codon:yes gene_type:complete
MSNQQIVIPIGDSDIELFEKLLYHGYDGFTWTFETNDGEPINIKFIKDTEDE